MKAVILSGGLGTRLKPFTQILPKPMLPVGDRSVLEIQVLHLKKFSVDEIFMATNYKSELMLNYFGDGSRFGVKLTHSVEDKPLGTCGPLSLLKDRLDGPFIVLNGDVLTNLDFRRAYDYHCGRGGVFTIVSKEVTFPLSYGNLVTEGDRLVKLQEKPDLTLEISTGIYFMNPGIFQYIPYNEHFGMDQLLDVLMEKNVAVYCYKMKEYWLDIGRMEDYEKAQNDYPQHFEL